MMAEATETRLWGMGDDGSGLSKVVMQVSGMSAAWGGFVFYVTIDNTMKWGRGISIEI